LAFFYLIRIDVTEVQIFIIIMHLLAVIGGPPFWQSLVILFMFLFHPFSWSSRHLEELPACSSAVELV